MQVQEQEVKLLKRNREDYKRFSFIFLFLSTFLYIGSLLPYDGKSPFNTSLVMLASCSLLVISMIFYLLMKRMEKKYKNM